jgi:hypothetical protein
VKYFWRKVELKEKIRRHGLKLGIVFFSLLALVLVAAVPGWAKSSPKAAAALDLAGEQILEGKVISIAGSTFVIQNGNQTPVTIVTGNSTLYFKLPVGKPVPGVKDSAGPNFLPPGPKGNNQGNGKGNPKPDAAAPTLTPSVKPAQIPPNWKNDLGFLGLFNNQATLSDLAVGDRVIVRADIIGNLAQQVLIIKASAIQKIKGTISGLVNNSLTITPVPGAAVVLTWDANTRFELKGLISVQNGQTATVSYNRNTNVAQNVSIQ